MFPRHESAWYLARLAEPTGRVSVIIDTDAANEIDDQFALAWALLSPQKLDVLAVYAAPFSFAHQRGEIVRAWHAQRNPGQAPAGDAALVRSQAARLAHFARQNWDPRTVELAVFNPPGIGMERSHAEIQRVFDTLGVPARERVFRGSTQYLRDPTAVESSPAVEHLVRTARSWRGPQPLYVVAIGCVTNVSSALLIAPDIVDKIVVVWTSGYPSHAPQVNNSFNLEQDMVASRVLFDSGVPLVYLPGFHVGAQLRLSLPEVERCIRGRGAIGDYLYHLFTHNPLWELTGPDTFEARSWVIWDVINVAFLIDPAWVASDIVSTPILGEDRRWRHGPGRPPMREAYAVARDAIFSDFFEALRRAPQG